MLQCRSHKHSACSLLAEKHDIREHELDTLAVARPHRRHQVHPILVEWSSLNLKSGTNLKLFRQKRSWKAALRHLAHDHNLSPFFDVFSLYHEFILYK